jgi:hypothetical protein
MAAIQEIVLLAIGQPRPGAYDEWGIAFEGAAYGSRAWEGRPQLYYFGVRKLATRLYAAMNISPSAG